MAAARGEVHGVPGRLLRTETLNAATRLEGEWADATGVASGDATCPFHGGSRARISSQIPKSVDVEIPSKPVHKKKRTRIGILRMRKRMRKQSVRSLRILSYAPNMDICAVMPPQVSTRLRGWMHDTSRGIRATFCILFTEG